MLQDSDDDVSSSDIQHDTECSDILLPDNAEAFGIENVISMVS